jgi:transposase-like protein
MNRALFASVLLSTLGAAAWPKPSRCPYCPGADHPHWIKWGFYERYAQKRKRGSRRVRVQRYRCKIVRRTFSLLADSLVPFQFHTVANILRWLYRLLVEQAALAQVSRAASVARTTLRNLRDRFVGVVPRLRLPGRPAALSPPEFLKALGREGNAVIDLFRNWKQLEPKHSVVGIYAR